MRLKFRDGNSWAYPEWTAGAGGGPGARNFFEEGNLEVTQQETMQEANQEGNVREEGVVCWFRDDLGFRFRKRVNGSQAFAHFSEIEINGFKTLAPGQVVSVVVADTPKGLAAKEIQILWGPQYGKYRRDYQEWGEFS